MIEAPLTSMAIRAFGRSGSAASKIEFAHSDGDYPEEWKKKVRPVFVERLDAIERHVGHQLTRVSNRPNRIAPPLGRPGNYGAVYELEGSPDRVLKISTDEFEGPYSAYVRKLQGLGVESLSGPIVNASVAVFDVFRIEAPIDLWGIVIERIQTIHFFPSTQKVEPSSVPLFVLNGADRYNDGWNALRGHSIPLYDTGTGRRVGKRRKKITEAQARELVFRGLDILDRSALSRSLADFLRLVWDDDHPFTDLHRNNMGLRRKPIEGFPSTERGQLVAYDFGCSKVSSALRREAVRGGVKE